MYRISKLLQKLFCKEFGDGSDIWPSALVAFEGGFVRTVEDEDRVNRESDQS
jgi:hypothetical protein